MEDVYSSYFAENSIFPEGTSSFDCAMIMRNIQHEWHAANDLYVEPASQHRHSESRDAKTVACRVPPLIELGVSQRKRVHRVATSGRIVVSVDRKSSAGPVEAKAGC